MKRLHNMQRIQKLPECESSILGSPIRMEHKSIGSVSFFIGFPKGCNNQINIGIGRDMPEDNFS